MSTTTQQYFAGYKSLTIDQLKAKYRALSKQYHPDTETGSEQTMADINKEYKNALQWHQKRIERSKANIEFLKKLSEKTLEGIATLQHRFEPELNEFAINKIKIFIETKIPKPYRGIAEVVLSKIIDDSDMLQFAKQVLQQLNNKISKLNK
jgi:hypothetical protein